MPVAGRSALGLRVAGEMLDRAGDPAQRLQDQEGQTAVKQSSGDQRDQQRHQQAVDEKGRQFGLQGLGRRQNLDEIARTVARSGLDPDRTVRMAEQGAPGIGDPGHGPALAQIDQIRCPWQVGCLQQQPPDALVADDHGLHAADRQLY